MKFITNHSLKKLNTFGIDCKAKFYVRIENTQDVVNLIHSPILQNNKFFILGGGSNILFVGDFDGIVIDAGIEGISLVNESETEVEIEAGAGVMWHDLVTFCVENNYFGLENLALIPGKVGATPVQNIGAYGVEQKDCFLSLKGYNLIDGEFSELNYKQCNFGYRSSVFKNELAAKFLITSVTYKLSKVASLNLNYKDINEELQKSGITAPEPKDIFNAICKIRQRKLPDYTKIGNAGSFFKNPSISKSDFEKLKESFPDISGHETNDGMIKLSAGWLIEKCGLKGKRTGDAGVYEKHALVLVNHGNASGADIINLADEIIESIKERFGFELEKEVLVV